MSDQDSLFGEPSATPGTASQPTSPAGSEPALEPDQALATLVGEGRKYKDAAALAKAYIEADNFIERLKAENAAKEEKLKAASTLDQVLEKLGKATPNGSATDQGATSVADGTTPVRQLSADDVAKLVKDTVTGLETEKSRMANRLRAEAALREIHGDNAKAVFRREAPTPEARAALVALAEVSPDKFIALFKPAQLPSGSSFVPSSVSSAGVGSQPASRTLDPGAKEYYDALRKKDPTAYYSQATQLQMNKAASIDPDRFFGRKR